MTSRISCPNPECPQPDAVQKVGIIVSEGESHGRVGQMQSWPGYATYSQTALSAQLACPREHANEGKWDLEALFWITVGILVSGFAILSGIGGIIGSPASMQSTSNYTLGVIGAFAVGLGVGFWDIYTIRSKARKAREYTVSHEQWIKVVSIWERLYYCHRCGSVFDPTNPDLFVDAGKMPMLLRKLSEG